MSKILTFLWDTVKIVLIAFIIVWPIRQFLFQPFMVSGQSMEPNYFSDDYLVVEKISYQFREPIRGEVIVFQYPNDPSIMHIKRIIGLPGETIKTSEEGVRIISEEGIFFLDESDYLSYTTLFTERSLTLKKDEFFVMGDNRGASLDSRNWGPLPRENIRGKVFARLFPFYRFQIMIAPIY